MIYDNTRLRALLREIRNRAAETYDHFADDADTRYVYALGVIQGIADDALLSVAENRPLNISLSVREMRRKLSPDPSS